MHTHTPKDALKCNTEWNGSIEEEYIHIYITEGIYISICVNK